MDELDRYLYEINRIQKNVNLYHDLFCEDENRQTLNKFNDHIFSVFQRSLNTEIILSVAKAFDTDGYEYRNEKHEYLSQYNLVKKYESHLNAVLIKLRNKTIDIRGKLDIKSYRDFFLTHNNKLVMLGKLEPPKHLIETDILLELLQASYDLIYELRLVSFGIEPKDTVTRPVKYTSVNSSEYFINQLQNI